MTSGDAPLEFIGIEKIGSKPKSKQFYPFAYSLLDTMKETYCWTCLKKEVEVTCKTCNIAKFCTSECESAGSFDHKYECPALQKFPELKIEERMLLRIVGRYLDIQNGVDKKIADFYKNRESSRSVMEIWHHCEEMKNDVNAVRNFDRIYNAIEEFLGKIDKDIVFQLHSRNFINRHSISNPDYLIEIGKGLYLDLCRYDHSCRPNAIYSCNGTVASLRALHDNVDLEDVEKTHYTYIELPPCKIQRRHMLKETWYFECHCERCDDPADNWLTSVICPTCINGSEFRNTIKIHGPEAYANQETLEIICSRCQTTLDREYVYFALEGMRTIRQTLDGATDVSTDTMELLKIYQGALISYERVLPMSNSYFCQLIAAMIPLVQRASMTRRERAIASLDLHAKCEPFVRYVYRYAHPSKAMHFLQMGQLHDELGNGKEAARYLIEAHRIMDYLFGPGHYLSNQTKNLMNYVLQTLKTFQKNFVNVLERVPEAKDALNQRFLMKDEKLAIKEAAKNKKNKNKKNKHKGKQYIQEKNVENDELGDLPELISQI